MHAQANQQFDFGTSLNIEEILATTPSGTPAREENEFKMQVTGSEKMLNKNSYLIGKMHSALERALTNDLVWKAPQHTDSKYRILNVGKGTFCFLDIYLDTADGLNYHNGISYRVRYRWHSRAALVRYLLGSTSSADFPHRCEYQLKVYANAWSKSFNNCLETRFEYRNESFPFKVDNSAPPPPWPFDEYILPAIIGRYKSHNVITTHEYARLLGEKLKLSGEIRLKPSLIVVTTRRRIHLGLKNEFGLISAQQGFGSAVNADQVILATFDSSEVYRPDFLDIWKNAHIALSHNSLTPRLRKRLKRGLNAVAGFSEVEFEFERNIESAIAFAIMQSNDPQEITRLKEIKADFLEDLQTISRVIGNCLSELGFSVKDGEKSKYQKAWETINP